MSGPPNAHACPGRPGAPCRNPIAGDEDLCPSCLEDMEREAHEERKRALVRRRGPAIPDSWRARA